MAEEVRPEGELIRSLFGKSGNHEGHEEHKGVNGDEPPRHEDTKKNKKSIDEGEKSFQNPIAGTTTSTRSHADLPGRGF